MNDPKTMYWVTEKQLMTLQLLVWGAEMTRPEEPQRFADTLEKIRTQLLSDIVGHKIEARE